MVAISTHACGLKWQLVPLFVRGAWAKRRMGELVLPAYIQTGFPSLHYRYDKRCAVTTALSAQIVACANRPCEVVEMNGRQLNQPRQARVRGMQDPATACRSRPQTERWHSCHRSVRVDCAVDPAVRLQRNRRRTVTHDPRPALSAMTSGRKHLPVHHKFQITNHASRITQHVSCSRSGVQHHEPINPA